MEREVLEVRETVTEEFLLDGQILGRRSETVSERVEIDVEEATVTVALSNGADHKFPFEAKELVQRLRDASVAYFVQEKLITAIPSLALFKGGKQLAPQETLAVAGVSAGDEVLLQSTEHHADGR